MHVKKHRLLLPPASSASLALPVLWCLCLRCPAASFGKRQAAPAGSASHNRLIRAHKIAYKTPIVMHGSLLSTYSLKLHHCTPHHLRFAAHRLHLWLPSYSDLFREEIAHNERTVTWRTKGGDLSSWHRASDAAGRSLQLSARSGYGLQRIPSPRKFSQLLGQPHGFLTHPSDRCARAQVSPELAVQAPSACRPHARLDSLWRPGARVAVGFGRWATVT